MRLIKPIRKRKNKLKNYFFLIILLLFSSCWKNEQATVHNNLPVDSIISRGQMVKILADIHVLEAALLAVKKKGTNEQRLAAFYYSQFFSKHHISEKRFRTNLVNYQSEPEQFYLLYEDVVKELAKRLRIQKPGKSNLE